MLVAPLQLLLQFADPPILLGAVVTELGHGAPG
jgi:hypothetical protein